MRNLNFRSDTSLALYSNRPHRLRWLIPTLLLTTGSLYGALQLQWGDDHLHAPGQTANPIALPLQLPNDRAISVATDPIPPLTPTQSPVASVTGAPNIPLGDLTGSKSPALTLGVELAKPEETDRWLVHEIQQGDSLARIFKNIGLSTKLLHKIVHSGKAAKELVCIIPGQTLHIRFDTEDKFAELVYQIGPARKLRVSRQGDGWEARLLERDVDVRSNEISAVIESSLFESAQKAGLSDTLTMQLAKIFGWDIDFAMEIRSGDRFSVIFSEQWLDGKKLKDGPILAAEFVNRGKVYRAVRFVDASGKAGYYTPGGKRMKKEFLRTPLKFSRISSKFTKRRWHPVLKRWRSHKGVDYAASTGTPVKAAGDAKATFVGRKNGYGKVIFLQHQGKYTTVYGHLSRFAKGIKTGQRIKQGQLIGYVGQTGLATGPHLHYEFRVNGRHRNPLKVTRLPAAPIDKKSLPAFKKATQPLLARLGTLHRTMVADAR